MLRQRKNTKEFDRKVKENPRRWGEEGGDFLLIYALKMPAIDIHRYCHSRVARRPCLGQQPKLKLHFTVVFQVVAQLSRNFNIPRRERLKIQPATCHSIATFHATCPLPAPSSPRLVQVVFPLLLSSRIPLLVFSRLRGGVSMVNRL